MITKVRNRPENIYMASDYRKVGEAIGINRERVAITAMSVLQANSKRAEERIESYTSDNVITDAEKPSLKRELDALERDFGILGRETLEAGLGESEEYKNTEEAYDTLAELFRRIINSKGTYDAPDVSFLSTYFAQYTAYASVLENSILEVQAQANMENNFYSRTRVNVITSPDAVGLNGETSVFAKVYYDGEEVTGYLNHSYFEYDVSGVASEYTPSMITVPAGAVVTYNSEAHTLNIKQARTFSLKRNAISDAGIDIVCTLTVDSGSMPF